MLVDVPVHIHQDLRVRSNKSGCSGCGNTTPLGFEFEYAFQPIVDIRRQEVFAYEALVRGPNGESAASVLAKVNDNNRYQFDQACRTKAVRTAVELGIQTFLSINFLPNAVYRPEACIQSTLRASREFGFPHEKIIFEVTEGEKVIDRPHLLNIFRKYRSLGFKTAIDDFGEGYSGLNLLSEFQPDILKLDMNLVRNIHIDEVRHAIVEGMALTSRRLNIRLIAEGVETQEELDCLSELGIELFQGYLFAKPGFRSLPKFAMT